MELFPSQTTVPAAVQAAPAQRNPELVSDKLHQSELNEQFMMDERMLIFETLKHIETAQAERFANHQNAIEQLFQEQHVGIERLLEAALEQISVKLLPRRVAEAATPTGGVPVSEASNGSRMDEAPELYPSAMQPEPESVHASQSGQQQSDLLHQHGPHHQSSPVLEREVSNALRHKVFINQIHNLTYAPSPLQLLLSPKTLRQLSTPPETKSGRFAQSDIANVLSGIVIVANAFFFGIQTSVAMSYVLKDPPQNYTGMDSIQHAFTYLFATEVAARVLALRMSYFFGADWSWNLFDLIMVSASVAEKLSNNFHSDLVFLRILRVLRLARIFRVLRNLRIFRELRLVVCSFMASMAALSWAISVVVLVIYMCAVVFMQGLLSYIEQLDVTDAKVFVNDETAIKEWYGSLPKTMFSLVMAVSGGVNWYELTKPLERISVLLPVVFWLYVTFVVFGATSVIVGVFVDRTALACRNDLHLTLHNEVDKVEAFLRHMRYLFRDAGCLDGDADNLTYDEFKACMGDNSVQLYLKSHELDVSDAHTIFEMLQTCDPMKGGITVDDFVYGCLQSKGVAKGIDLQQLLYDSQIVRNSICDGVKSNSIMLKRCADTLTTQFAVVRHELEELRRLSKQPHAG